MFFPGTVEVRCRRLKKPVPGKRSKTMAGEILDNERPLPIRYWHSVSYCETCAGRHPPGHESALKLAAIRTADAAAAMEER
jgi:hypothetical protein